MLALTVLAVCITPLGSPVVPLVYISWVTSSALGRVALKICAASRSLSHAGSVSAALNAVRAAAPDIPVEVEVDSLAQLDEVLELKPQLVLLDNFEPWATQMAVQRRNTRSPETKLESSGGLTLDVARDYARTGVDYIAVGGLTHSVTVLDLGLDIPT